MIYRNNYKLLYIPFFRVRQMNYFELPLKLYQIKTVFFMACFEINLGLIMSLLAHHCRYKDLFESGIPIIATNV